MRSQRSFVTSKPAGYPRELAGKRRIEILTSVLDLDDRTCRNPEIRAVQLLLYDHVAGEE